MLIALAILLIVSAFAGILLILTSACGIYHMDPELEAIELQEQAAWLEEYNNKKKNKKRSLFTGFSFLFISSRSFQKLLLDHSQRTQRSRQKCGQSAVYRKRQRVRRIHGSCDRIALTGIRHTGTCSGRTARILRIRCRRILFSFSLALSVHLRQFHIRIF